VSVCGGIPACQLYDGACQTYSPMPVNSTTTQIRAEITKVHAEVNATINSKIQQEGAITAAKDALKLASKLSATVLTTLENDIKTANTQIGADETTISGLEHRITALEKQLWSSPPATSDVSLMQASAGSGSWCAFMPISTCAKVSGCALSSDGSTCKAQGAAVPTDPQAVADIKAQINLVDSEIQLLIADKVRGQNTRLSAK
jgi:hypothetical protein